MLFEQAPFQRSGNLIQKSFQFLKINPHLYLIEMGALNRRLNLPKMRMYVFAAPIGQPKAVRGAKLRLYHYYIHVITLLKNKKKNKEKTAPNPESPERFNRLLPGLRRKPV